MSWCMCVYTSQPRTCKMYGYTVCGKTITLTEASSSTEADLHSFLPMDYSSNLHVYVVRINGVAG